MSFPILNKTLALIIDGKDKIFALNLGTLIQNIRHLAPYALEELNT